VSAYLLPSAGAAADAVVDEVHYALTGPTSVNFQWRGAATDIRYGPSAAYGSSAEAHAPDPLPISSTGPFREVELTGLRPGARYHYSIGGGPDATFETAPTGQFRFDVEADVGSSLNYSKVAPTQADIAADEPAFVLVPGDLSYGHPDGQAAVDQHFNDVMAWSRTAAYMPAWGNHEWDTPEDDDLRNYKGRFALPNAQASPGAPSAGCCGEDWGWFDAGAVRFISYPEPYTGATWTDWKSKADAVLAAAQADPGVRYIVTFGHRPAYSTGSHPGSPTLAGILDGFGDRYSKYVLNLNGHSHDYERFEPIHGVTHVTTGGGGATLEPPWTSTDPRTAFRAMHLEHLRVDVTASGMRVDAVCGPPSAKDEFSCAQGSVIDSFTIGTVPPSELYVDQHSASCTDTGAGSKAQPLCTLGAAASRASAGTTVEVASGTYSEQVEPRSGLPDKPVVFAAAPGADVTVGGQKNGFRIAGDSWVTVKGLTVGGTSGDGIAVSDSDHIEVSANRVTGAGSPESGSTARGIVLTNVSESKIAYNSVDHNTDFGIFVTDGSTRNAIVGNRASANAREFDRAASGIRVYASPDNTLSSNVAFDNEDSGIEVFAGSDRTLVVGNSAYRNGDHGLDAFRAVDERVVSNSVYDNMTAGINVEDGSTGATVVNNISVANGVGGPRTRGNIRVDSTSVDGTNVDYDLLNVDSPVNWANVPYRSLSEFTAATGQEQHGIEADPGWTSPDNGDFHLTPQSPAVDAAKSSAIGQRDTDADGNARIDDPAKPNSGVGPRGYDDRGAFEYQPPPYNLVGNPGFETGITGWNTSGSGPAVTLARAPGGHTGGWSAELLNSATTSGSCVLNDSPNWVKTTGDGTYTARLWVRADRAGATLRLRVREYNGATPLGDATATKTLATSWQLVSLTYTPAAPGASTLDFNANVSSAGPGSCFYADDAAVYRRAPAPATNPACRDGQDNDGDGRIDYPTDIGCTGPDDDDESEPPVGDNNPPADAGGSGASSSEDSGALPAPIGPLSLGDSTPPDTAIISGPRRTIRSDKGVDATFMFDSTEPGSRFECRVDADGVAWEACVSPWQRFNLIEGPHAVLVRAIDPAGNVDPTPAHYEWRVVGANVAVSGIPRRCTREPFKTRIIVRDSLPLARVEVLVDGKRKAAKAKRRFTVTIPVRGLKRGRHRVVVVVVDPAGHRASKSMRFKRC